MINECESHGYYRGREDCPVCGRKGRFVMSDIEVEKIGRTLAAILRHGKFGLEMDPQGFVLIREIVETIRGRNPRTKWLREWQLESLALTDPKGRYQIVGDKLRATYGHTLKLDLMLPTDDVPKHLYYPVDPEEVDEHLERGIQPTDRAMVHLSKTYQDALRAGSVRIDDPEILEVDVDACFASGHPIGKAARTVYLLDEVPAEAVSVAEEPE